VDTLGIATVQRSGLVGAPVLHAAAQHLTECLLDRGIGLERERPRLVPGRRFAIRQGVAEGRFAARLDAQGCQRVELQSQVVERLGRAFEQLQLDLGNPLAAAFGLDRAMVQRGFDQALPALAIDFPDPMHLAAHPGRELRFKLVCGHEVPENLQRAGRHDREVRLARGQRRFPFAAIADQSLGIIGFEGLDVASPLPADAKRQTAGAQPLVLGVVVDVLEPFGDAAPGRFVADHRTGKNPLQGFRRPRQLELDLHLWKAVRC
jgi:hypothetical protein